jgi:hypothetical protein
MHGAYSWVKALELSVSDTRNLGFSAPAREVWTGGDYQVVHIVCQAPGVRLWVDGRRIEHPAL